MTRRRRFVIAIALMIPIFFYWAYGRAQEGVSVGTGMIAKQMCSCVFVSGRDDDACRADQMPLMDRVRVAVEGAVGRGMNDGKPGLVRAWVPGLAERIARFEAPYGCTLE